MKNHHALRIVRSSLLGALTLALIAGSGAAFAQEASPETKNAAVLQRLKTDVSYLADDDLEGRGPGTKGIDLAADYIAAEFKKAGLKPAPGLDGYFQHFEVPGRPTVSAKTSLASTASGDSKLDIKAELHKDFTPLAVGSAGQVEPTEVVFAGYGITAKDADNGLDYDDYRDLEVKGKTVLILRHKPQQKDPKGKFGGPENTTYSSLRHKATNAYQHGAAMVIMVNNSTAIEGKGDELMTYATTIGAGRSSLPYVMATRSFADQLLKAAGEPSLADLEKKIDESVAPVSRPLKNVKVSADVIVDRNPYKLKNVIGVLEGDGPLAEETLVVGGHYDHLGRGEIPGSMSFNSRNEIHNGADDNASGTSMVIEMARRMASRSQPLPRRMLFMAYAGEEMGLFGSAHYVNHPVAPLDKTVFMFNFDMVGRLNEENELWLMGLGSSPDLKGLCESAIQPTGMKLRAVQTVTDGRGGSDHQSFYNRGVPVLFAFTGLHSQYHRPADDIELINFDGMTRIADLMETLILKTATRPERPQFTKAVAPAVAKAAAKAADPHAAPGGANASPGRVTGMGAYVGILPDYSYENGDGVRLEGASDGGPAQKAGLKRGDLITGFGGKKVGTLQDYMESLSATKPGAVIELNVIRDSKPVKIKVTAGSPRAPH